MIKPWSLFEDTDFLMPLAVFQQVNFSSFHLCSWCLLSADVGVYISISIQHRELTSVLWTLLFEKSVMQLFSFFCYRLSQRMIIVLLFHGVQKSVWVTELTLFRQFSLNFANITFVHSWFQNTYFLPHLSNKNMRPLKIRLRVKHY